MSLRSFVWTLRSLESPVVLRGCAGCGGTSRYRSSGKFRVNANGRKLDVWLIYRCEACGARWNRPVHERRAVSSIDDSELEHFLANDETLARKIELDFDGLRRAGAEPLQDESVRVSSSEAIELAREGDQFDITLKLVDPVRVRLDRVLTRELGLTRSAIAKMAKKGCLKVEPERKRALRRPVCDGQRVVIEL